MARRGRKRLYLYPSSALASGVIGSYTSKVPTKLGSMSRNYTANITSYLRDANRQADAARKLANWYDALFEHVDTIVDAYGSIRKAYKAKLKVAKGVAIPAPPPPVAVAPAVPAPVV